MKKFLPILLLLSACCSESSTEDCTQKELDVIRFKHEAEVTPQLVLSQDNIRLYRVWTIEPQARNHWTYFTTPVGNTSAEIEWSSGKNSSTSIQSTVNGVQK